MLTLFLCVMSRPFSLRDRSIVLLLLAASACAQLPPGMYRGKGYVVALGQTAQIAAGPNRVQFYDRANRTITDVIDLKAPSAEDLLRSFVENHDVVLGFRAMFGRSDFTAYGNWTGRVSHGEAVVSGMTVAISATAIEANGTTYLLLMQGQDGDFYRLERFNALANSLRFDRPSKPAQAQPAGAGSTGGCPGCGEMLLRSMDAITKQTLRTMK
ncbi:MAG: hypothetical protein H7Y20_13085 [Bryobacteraceae bacterium]|nr:hypothetical protein [Bryobacteraceae bacterium]